MTVLSIRLTDEDLRVLDQLVADGVGPTRSAALRAAMHRARRESDSAAVTIQYAEAFAAQPQTADEAAWATAAPAGVAWDDDW